MCETIILWVGWLLSLSTIVHYLSSRPISIFKDFADNKYISEELW